ncbi:MAG: HAMP domain-containing histidine kinase [Bdellovibrionales bacterium]|nr:HAMP domain-containing histidine kinase [Bdellovibrionales bacterium]
MHKLLPHLYETIAHEAMFGIVVFEASGVCLFSNRMADQMLGAESHQLAAMVPTESHPQLKTFTPEFCKQDGFYQDILVRRSDGSTFISNLGVRFIEVDGHQAHLLMLQDVTLQKKLQREIMAKQTEIKATFEELLNQNRKLKELDHAKDRFIALTTHELRTPLSAMVASAEILKLGIYDNEEQMREFIEMIYDQGLHLQDLVNDILDFAKIQAGKMDFYIEKQDPVALVNAVAKNFEGMAETNKVKLHLHVPSAPVECYFDELRLRQILSNIINNAIKYNKPQGRVDIEFADMGDAIKISVKDTGQGIAKDQFEKVFNEFETIGQVALHHKGTGLGMPISRKLSEGMGGKLLLDSELGVGSVFWVELPKQRVLEDGFYRPRFAS